MQLFDDDTDDWQIINRDITELSKPEFSVYSSSTQIQSHKITSEIMLNNNNNNNSNSNIDDMIEHNKLKHHYEHQKLSPIYDSMYVADKGDRCFLESIDDNYYTIPASPIDSNTFSPTTKSPLGLTATGSTTEESFNFEMVSNGNLLPIKYSQDFEDCLSFADEIDKVAQLTEFEADYHLNVKEEKDEINNNCSTTTEDEGTVVLYQDSMMNGFVPIQRTELEIPCQTVNHYSDILIKSEEEKLPTIVIDDCTNSNDSKETATDALCFLTPSPSPHRVACNNIGKLNSTPSNHHIDHNYIVVQQPEHSTCKRKLVLEPITAQTENNANMRVLASSRVGHKTKSSGKRPIMPKLQMPKKFCRQESVKSLVEIGTPEITADILRMEDESFDLINYINSSQESTKPTALPKIELPPKASIQNQRAEQVNIMKWLESVVKPNKHRRPSIDNPQSVQSDISDNYSDDSSSILDAIAPPNKKRRGRPPKTTCSMPSPSQFDEKDVRYQEMRYKNNEASRRSRLNRKEKEEQAMAECHELEQKHSVLRTQEAALERELKKMRSAVMKLAQLQF